MSAERIKIHTSKYWRSLRQYLTIRNTAIGCIVVSTLILGGLLVNKMTEVIQGDATPGIDTALALLGLKVLTYILAPLGGAGLKIIAGSLLGWQGAFIVIVVGDTLGSVANYYLGKYGIRLFAQNKAKPTTRTTKWSLEKTWNLVALRILLSPGWDLLSYGLGAKGIRFRKFFIASLVGGVPASVAWAIVGDWLSTALGQREIIIVASIGIAIGLAIFIVHRISRRVSRSVTPSENDSSEHEANADRALG